MLSWTRPCLTWWYRSRLRGVDPVLFGALVVGVLVRVWAFGSLPAGMNQDETAMGYDAYALIHHGIDRLGFRFPVMLVSWGSGMNALASYLAAPFVGVFGLHPWSARLPFLLGGIASLPLFFVLLLDTVGRRAARLGTVLLAISPWHIMISRWGLEANMLPVVVLGAMVLVVRARDRPRLLIPAGATFGLALYAYGTAYVFVPLVVVVLLGYGLLHRLWPLRVVLWAAAAFVLVALPIELDIFINTFGLPSITTPFISIPRMSGIARFRTMGNVDILSYAFVTRAFRNWKIAADIFQTQEDGLISNVVPGYGMMYWFSPFLALAGFALLCGRAVRRRYDPSFFLWAWSVTAIVLTAFVEVNVNRANVALLPFIACVALTAAALWPHRPLAATLSLLFGVSFVGFVSVYFGTYRTAAASKFYASFGEAIQFAAQQTPGEICITNQPEQPYIFVLFYNREEPQTFYKTVRYLDPAADFHTVLSFGRYRFGLPSCRDTAPVVVATHDEASSFDQARFSVTRFERYTVLTRTREGMPPHPAVR